VNGFTNDWVHIVTTQLANRRVTRHTPNKKDVTKRFPQEVDSILHKVDNLDFLAKIEGKPYSKPLARARRRSISHRKKTVNTDVLSRIPAGGLEFECRDICYAEMCESPSVQSSCDRPKSRRRKSLVKPAYKSKSEENLEKSAEIKGANLKVLIEPEKTTNKRKNARRSVSSIRDTKLVNENADAKPKRSRTKKSEVVEDENSNTSKTTSRRAKSPEVEKMSSEPREKSPEILKRKSIRKSAKKSEIVEVENSSTKKKSVPKSRAKASEGKTPTLANPAPSGRAKTARKKPVPRGRAITPEVVKPVTKPRNKRKPAKKSESHQDISTPVREQKKLTKLPTPKDLKITKKEKVDTIKKLTSTNKVDYQAVTPIRKKTEKVNLFATPTTSNAPVSNNFSTPGFGFATPNVNCLELESGIHKFTAFGQVN
jgi:hypothetical protein